MSNLEEAEIIDLTKTPFDYTRLNSRRVFGNSNNQETTEIIDLVNDSFCEETISLSETSRTDKRKSSKGKEEKSKNKAVKHKEQKSKKLAECPICRNELGTKPLASTKCGHVYCLSCIENSLKFNKLCPTCRCSLKGKSAYHPLFLDLS